MTLATNSGTLPHRPFGIALGGGGARALSHLGVLEVLDEAGLGPQMLAGSSMGALLGAMYAFNPEAKKVSAQALEYFRRSRFFGGAPKPARDDGLTIRPGVWAWIKKYFQSVTVSNIICLRRSLLRRNPSVHAANKLLPETGIEDAALPFSAVALDLKIGQLRQFSQGNARQIAAAATSVGVVFPPYHFADGIFIDAAPVSSVPVRAVRSLGAEVVLAVDLRTRLKPMPSIQNGFDVIQRLESIASSLLNDAEVAEAEISLIPAVADIFWGDFTRADEAVAAGRAATLEILPELQNLLVAEEPEPTEEECSRPSFQT